MFKTMGYKSNTRPDNPSVLRSLHSGAFATSLVNMTKIVALCVLILQITAVLCGLLAQKDTSYGFVPRDTKIVKYNSDADRWKPHPIGGTPPNVDSDTVVVNAPGQRNLSTETVKDSTLANEEAQPDSTRSRSFGGFPSTLYYYEPPPAYLPPPVHTDYTTSPPTEEEFINRPSNDEVPQYAPDPPFHGYHYVVPQTPVDDLLPPISHDEPIPDIPSLQYLPSPYPGPPRYPSLPEVVIAKAIEPNGINIKQTSIIDDETHLDGRHSKQTTPLHIEVTEMHCYDTPTDGRFQAVLTVKSPGENIPVFEDLHHIDGNSPCVVKSDSVPLRYNSKLKISISKRQFNACAIKDCSVSSDVVHLCVKLRFPTLARMKLAEDAVLTLQCRTQDRIAAHTKHLSIDVDNSESARSSDVAKGGARGGLRSRVGLYRRGASGGHTEPLPRGARVPIGELLMLRAQIEPEDGWVSSRLSSVSLAGGGGGGMALLGPDGCRLEGARALCPRESRSAPPLAHTLLIRAALFEGMRSGEEVRLSVRLVACLEASDCRTPHCQISGPGRKKRSTNNTHTTIDEGQHSSNHTLDTTSVISFKVVLPEEEIYPMEHSIPGDHTPVVVMISVLCAVIVCSSVLIFLKRQGRWFVGSSR